MGAFVALDAHGESVDDRYRHGPTHRRALDDHLREVVFGAFSPWPLAWVAVSEGVVGALSSTIHPYALPDGARVARVDRLWVAPDWRRRGVGRGLVLAWRQAASQRGADAFEVGTLGRDKEALAFWRALGFGDWQVVLRAERHDHGD